MNFNYIRLDIESCLFKIITTLVGLEPTASELEVRRAAIAPREPTVFAQSVNAKFPPLSLAQMPVFAGFPGMNTLYYRKSYNKVSNLAKYCVINYINLPVTLVSIKMSIW